MSETLWGVIIGGVIVIVGNIVVGLFQKHQTRITVDARRDEQSRQFEFEKEQKSRQLEFEKDQSIIARLIEERKKWIDPLRASLKEYSLHAKDAHNQLVSLRYSMPETAEGVPNSFITQSQRSSLSKIIGEWDKSFTKLLNSTAQISDPELGDIINNLLSAEASVSVAPHIEIDETQCASLESKAEEARVKVATAFKRMENLLSGKE